MLQYTHCLYRHLWESLPSSTFTCCSFNSSNIPIPVQGACIYCRCLASERVGGFDESASLTASLVAWPVSICPCSCGDGDRHFHIPFLLLVFIGGRKGLAQNVHNCTCLGIPSYVHNYRSPTSYRFLLVGGSGGASQIGPFLACDIQ